MKLERCVKCGKALKTKVDHIDWDMSGSSHHYICRDCALEEDMETNEDDNSFEAECDDGLYTAIELACEGVYE